MNMIDCQQLQIQTNDVITELIAQSGLHAGQILVVGCSSSEIRRRHDRSRFQYGLCQSRLFRHSRCLQAARHLSGSAMLRAFEPCADRRARLR